MDGMILASAVHSNSRMLKKSANGTGLLFGLFGLSRLFGFWVERS
jgi:hypothetical protein